MASIEKGNRVNSAKSEIVNAAIAFTDALAGRYAGRANERDRAGVATKSGLPDPHLR